MHFPEELIHAAGALPVVLRESNEPVTVGFGHIYPFYCGFSRSNVGWAVKGRLGPFDAVVISDVCLQLRHMGHIMRRHMPTTPCLYIQWPLEANADRWLSPSLEQLSRIRSRLGQLLGRPVTDEALRQSIALYNRHRSLLRRVYELRQQKPGVLRAKDMVNLVLAGMVMPKEAHIRLLEAFVPEPGKKRPARSHWMKLFASGHLCPAVKADILDLMEDLGGVVGDDLHTGHRYFATPVPTGAPPLEAMARHLGVALEDMGRLALTSTSPAQVSSLCPVCAESEIVSLSAQGYPQVDILAGLHEAIGRRLQSLVKGVGVRPRVMMSGGVAKNQGVVRVLERLLATPILIPPEPQIVGALGAALYALEEVRTPAR